MPDESEILDAYDAQREARAANASKQSMASNGTQVAFTNPVDLERARNMAANRQAAAGGIVLAKVTNVEPSA